MAEAASIDNGISAAIVALLCHLPETFKGLWWTVDEYCDMLRIGGLEDLVSVAQVRAAIRTDKTCIFTRNGHPKKTILPDWCSCHLPWFCP